MTGKKTPDKYVTVAWLDVVPCARCASVGGTPYHEAAYRTSQVPLLLSRLHAAGVLSVTVDGKEVSTMQSIASKGA